MAEKAENAVQPDQLRSALRLWASGVTLVTAGHQGVLHGMTVSSFSSVSLEPPLVSVNIERRTRTHQLMQSAGHFAVCVLSSEQRALARRFGGGLPDDSDRFVELEYSLSTDGDPIPDGCLAVLECRIVGSLPAGTHTVFIGQVQATRQADQASPLLYYDREYRRLADGDEKSTS